MATETLRLYLIVGGVIFADQITKLFIQSNYSDLVVINTAGSWGILPAWVGIIGIGILAWVMYAQKMTTYSLMAVLAGGVSNLLDRLVYGGVVDFIRIGSFPVFNLADSIITCGVLWAVIKEFKKRKTL